MKVDLNEEEIDIIQDLINFAEDPCCESGFWSMIFEDEGEEEYDRLMEISDNAQDKLYKALEKIRKENK